MSFLRFLISIPEHILAILLGVVILPLRLLFHTLTAILALFVLSAALLIALPVLLSFFLFKMNVSILTIIGAPMIIPIIATIEAIVLLAVVVGLTLITAFKLIPAIWLGFKSGLLNGLGGFSEAYSAQRFPITVLDIFTDISAFMNRRRSRTTGMSFRSNATAMTDLDGFERIVGDFQDVVLPPRDNDIPDMQGKAPISATLLKEEEINAAQELIKAFAQSTTPVNPQTKTQLELLKTKLEQYDKLSTKFKNIQKALIDGTEVADELVAYNDVVRPILFAKQYQETDRQWHNVPATSYVTDLDSLLTWLKTSRNANHPLNSRCRVMCS